MKKNLDRDDEVNPEILELFENKQNLPAGFRKGVGPSDTNDLANDPQGRRLHVYRPGNPEERYS